MIKRMPITSRYNVATGGVTNFQFRKKIYGTLLMSTALFVFGSMAPAHAQPYYVLENDVYSGAVDPNNPVWDTSNQVMVGLMAQGSLTLQSGASATIRNDIYVGRNTGSNGTLTINNASEMALTGMLYIGDGTGSTGAVVVSGSGSRLEFESNPGYSGYNLIIGNSGAGSLTVSGQSQVTVNRMLVGNNAGSNGTLTVNTGGTLTVNGMLRIGESPALHDPVSGAVIISAANGVATVDGQNSNLHAGQLVVGGNGGKGSLTISNQGNVSSTLSILYLYQIVWIFLYNTYA